MAAALTISELADAARTSETTVLRFCKRLGMPGYPELRLALAAESAQPRLLTASKSDINEDDTVDDIISKVAYADASAVEETAQQLDREALTRAADAIAAATRVDLYGIAASGVVAARRPAEAAPDRGPRVRLERPARRPDQRDAAGPR